MPHTILLLLLPLVNSVISITVTTTHGPVEGQTLSLFNGKDVDTFLGIPYAEAPVGNRRFSPPQPLTPWTETLQAKRLPRPCYQAATGSLKKAKWFISDAPETEDCLYLNLWVPKSGTPNQKKAIMIWLHPGGFFAGSSEIPMYNGAVLASEQNVIVASMNYRLSALGFLFLNSNEVPGNMGLQDQIQAITWIKDNAGVFGGDPDRITLFGESAGSMAVGFHLTNMNIYDLFQRGIMESGPMDMAVVSNTRDEALEKAYTLAKSLSCSIEEEGEMLACLRGKTPEEILKDHLSIPKYLIFEFVPVRNGIEVPFSPSNVFEDIPPSKRKNLLSGTIPNEISYFMEYFNDGTEFSEDIVINENHIESTLGDIFHLRNKIMQNIVLFQLRNFDRPFNRSQLREEFGNLLTDPAFNCLQRHFTKTWATDTNNVFYYSFQHRPSKAIKTAVPEWAGAVHGDDIPFVFGLPLNVNNGYTESERELSKTVMAFWGNFAKTGDPNGLCSPNLIWPRMDPSGGNVPAFVIHEHMRTENDFMAESCAFWEEVYPDLLKLQDELNKIK